MKNVKRIAPILVVLAVACASVGGGDPVVVRAEDFLVNSLSVYDSAMKWHEQHSTQESPAAYKALEQARVNFPPAWQAAKNGVASYKINKDKAQLDRLLAAVQTILDSIAPLVGGR